MLIETWETITMGIPIGIFMVLKNTSADKPIVRLGISTGSRSSIKKIPGFLARPFKSPIDKKVASIVEMVAEDMAIMTLFLIASLARRSLASSTNHFQVKPFKGKL